jgi:hypothetical protein
MTTPAYAAIEEQLDLLNFYADRLAAQRMVNSVYEASRNPPAGMLPKPIDGEAIRIMAEKMAAAVEDTLSNASPYFVTAEIQQILRTGMESFPDETSIEDRHLPTPAGFALLEEEVPLPPSVRGYDQPLKAIGWSRSIYGNGVDLFFFGPSRDPSRPGDIDFKMQLQTIFRVIFGKDLVELESWDVSERIGIETEEDKLHVRDRTRIGARWAASLLHFMSQRIAALELRPAPRPTRRRFEREAKRETPLIRTIVLRAREAKARYGEEAAGGSWTVRSIRRAHWHHYWCSGGSDQCLHPGHTEPRLELRWVEATVCGPDGAPLKRPIDLYSVSR